MLNHSLKDWIKNDKIWRRTKVKAVIAVIVNARSGRLMSQDKTLRDGPNKTLETEIKQT